MECAKALALQGKAKKTTKNTHKIYFCILIFNLKFCFLSLSIFFNIRNDIINIDPFRRGQQEIQHLEYEHTILKSWEVIT